MTQRAVWLWAAGLAAAVVVTVHFVDFPGSVPRFEKVSGGGVLLDAVPSFSSDAIYARLADYGAERRSSYSFRNVTVDLLLPLSVLPFLFLFMRKAVTAFRFEHVSVVTVLLAFPLAYVAFDLVENTIVLLLLRNYPARMDMLAAVLPYVTVIKRLFSLLAILIPVLLLVIRALNRREATAV